MTEEIAETMNGDERPDEPKKPLRETDADDADDADDANDAKVNGDEREPEKTGAKRPRDSTEAFDPYEDAEPILERLFLAIERIEKEIDSTARANKRLRTESPTPAADAASSRPSSGMSARSESDSAPIEPETASPRGRKASADTADPAYRAPFARGWRRELVYRANSEQTGRRQGDVYYYSPSGKKLRSGREVAEHLAGTDLTVDNFTFFKEPIGINDPDKEIIREAKNLRGRTDSPLPLPEEGSEGKRTPSSRAKSTRSSADSPAGAKSNAESANSSPKTRRSAERSNRSTPEIEDAKDSAPSRSNPDSNPDSDAPTTEPSPEKAEEPKAPPLESEALKKYVAPLANPIANSIANSILNHMPLGNQINNQMSNSAGNRTPGQMTGRDMCPMRCPLANLETPTLQCSLCLCLYHNRCTGYIPNYSTSFVCKNCHLANSSPPTSASPSRIAHPSGARPVQKSPSVSASSIPRFPKSTAVTKTPPQPRLVPVVASRPKTFGQSPKATKNDTSPLKIGAPKYPKPIEKATDNKRLPPTTSRPHESDPTIFPQSIAILNGHKFIVVPKPVSVSGQTATATSDPKHADNAPGMIESPLGTKHASLLRNNSFEDIKEDAPKPNVISFDNLSAEYGKLLFRGDAGGFPFGALKRNPSSDSADDGNKRKTRGPPVPKLVPKVTKKAENGTPNQKVGGRGSKNAEAKNKNYFAEFYKISQENGYNSIVQIFQYLKMRELAAAARVCRMWRIIANTPALWKSVRMKNSQVNDWAGLAAALKRHGTRHLDLRKMLLPPEVPEKVWDQFTEHIPDVDSLIRIDLCRCPASVVERICARMPQLQALTATSVKCTELNPSPLASLCNLQELRIKGMTNITLSSDLKCLENLTKLKHLSITSVKDLGQCGCVVIGNLTSLESLELGECTGEVGGGALLRRLTSLNRLRLERCPSGGGGTALICAAATLPLLQQLELINFDIRPGFEDALGKCTNIKRLLIIPTYISQSATTNRCVLAGVLRLRSSLTHLVWGVTIELLRVTELFIDQCGRNQSQSSNAGQNQDSKQPQMPLMNSVSQRNPKVVGDCVPILKPVPCKPNEESEVPAKTGSAQVEIMALPALQRLLSEELPTTRLKLLRIPFHATWRQNFNDFD